MSKSLLYRIFGILSMAILLCCPNQIAAQQNIATVSSSEKIYLQLDNKVYTTDNTIWFKAVVVHTDSLQPTLISNVLYVELIDPSERILESKILKLTNGISDGFFELKANYHEGLYQVRAYTKWNLNFGSDFVFSEYIRVFPANLDTKANPFGKITLIDKENKTKQLKTDFVADVGEWFPDKKIPVSIYLDNQKDSLLLKKNKDGAYSLDYTVPVKSNYITLQIKNKNNESFTKTLTLNKDNLDLQFFPESGQLVHGLTNLVGLKALDSKGKGITVEGDIVTTKGDSITHFKSNPLGMGSFVLKPDSAFEYVALVKSANHEKINKVYALPHVSALGNTLSVSQKEENIRILSSSNYMKSDSICLSVVCRGVTYYSLKEKLRNGSIVFSLNANMLPAGIIVFTMLDGGRKPLAERLFFNEKPDELINIALSTDKGEYSQRDSTLLTIRTFDGNNVPVTSNVSVMVVNDEQVGKLLETKDNILSYLLLSSELKGEIENPRYYLKASEDRARDLDALMLTQGWRNYKYTRLVENIQYQPQRNLEISGVLGGVFSKNKKQAANLVLMTLGKTNSIQTETADSLGRFTFAIPDCFGKNLEFLLQTSDKRGKKRDYFIALDKTVSPAVTYRHALNIEEADSTTTELVKKNLERKKIDDNFRIATGSVLLKEVVVDGYRMTPQRKLMAEKYGKPNVVIEGKAIRAKEKNWSYGLYSILLFEFGDKLEIRSRRWKDGSLILFPRIFGAEMTLVVVDGIPLRGGDVDDYALAPYISPSEVKSVEIIECASNFASLYLEVTANKLPPSSCIPPPIACGGIVSIYTQAGRGLYGALPRSGILNSSIPVFSESKEYYTPKYRNLTPNDWVKPDKRALIHWQPQLLTDSTGKAQTSFFNADNTGKMRIVVEAISENGKIGYQELMYDVKKRTIEAKPAKQ